jgi:hypothetical protein
MRLSDALFPHISPRLRIRTGRPVRWAGVALLLAVSAPLYLRLLVVAPNLDRAPTDFLWPLLGVTICCVGATWLVLGSAPAASRRGRWIELGLIFLGGLVLRAIFVAAPPTLSHDAYRYAWDAQLIAHGVSPYTHVVADPALANLRDAAIWPQVEWRDSPTIYPPGAQLLYLAAHVIAPLNIWGIKAAILLCDLVTGALTLGLLRHYGLDLRRALVYWWAPVPILEYAFSAHVDAVAAMWTLAAVLVAAQHWRGARIVTGLLLALAVTTKLYPLIFAVALVRRRDWGFLVGLAGGIAVIYLPFVVIGLGAGGFLGTYFSQRFVDQGIVFRAITTLFVAGRIQFFLEALSLAASAAIVYWLRVRRGLSVPAAILALSVAWIAASPHLFPWYVGPLLPFLALYLRAPRLAGSVRSPDLAGARPELGVALWLFTLAIPFAYVIFAPGENANLFPLFSLVPLGVAIVPYGAQRLSHRVRARLASRLPAAAPLAQAANRRD